MAKICDCKALFVDDFNKQFEVDGILAWATSRGGVPDSTLHVYFCSDCPQLLSGCNFDERFGKSCSWNVVYFSDMDMNFYPKIIAKIKKLKYLNENSIREVVRELNLPGHFHPDFDCPAYGMWNFSPHRNYDFIIRMEEEPSKFEEIEL